MTCADRRWGPTVRKGRVIVKEGILTEPEVRAQAGSPCVSVSDLLDPAE